ncbi:MAG: hypothetical protein IPJ39_16855 [Saprospiraceae bacterium]|nr:hypothetical protein [Saprospiraceae bacterium]
MRDISDLNTVLNDPNLAPDLRNIAEKVLNHQRISNEDANILFEQGEPFLFGKFSQFYPEKKNMEITRTSIEIPTLSLPTFAADM